ncbi:MAG TPA: ATP-binding protein [Mycobacteriales bacterium]|nr:ATP-binding protein [Mycobacteriales bacterium]
MAVVELLLSPLPSHVRTARLVVVAAARRAGLDDELVDELRLALGEACARAVGLHARHVPDQPVQVTISDTAGGLSVQVTDQGPAAGPAVDDVSAGLLESDGDGSRSDFTGVDRMLDALVDPDVALAVVTGLVDDVDVEHGPGGTVVTMRWPLPTAAQRPGGTAVATS